MSRKAAHLSAPPPDTPSAAPSLIQRSLIIILSWLPAVLSLFGILVLMQQYQLDLSTLLIWLGCVGLLALYHILAGDARYHLWTWYLSVGLLMCWLTLGLPAALVLALVAPGVALGVWWCCAEFFSFPMLPQDRISAFVGIRSGIGVVFLLVAHGLYLLLKGQLPLTTITVSDILPLGSVFFIVALGLQILVTAYVNRQRSVNWRDDLWDGLIFIPVAALTPIILYQLGYILFLVVLLIIGLHTIRYRYIGKSDRHYREFQQKLNLLNTFAPRITPYQSESNGMQAVCQAALAVTHSQEAGVFLLDRVNQCFQLYASVDITPQGRYMLESTLLLPTQWPFIMADPSQQVRETLHEVTAPGGQPRRATALPLRHGGSLLGCLVINTAPDYTLPQTDLTLLIILANYAAGSLNSANVVQELESYVFETTHLLSLSRATANINLGNSDNFDYIAAAVSQMVNVQWVMLLLADNSGIPARILGQVRAEISHDAEQVLRLPEFLAFDNMTPSGMYVYRAEDESCSEGLQALMAQDGLDAVVLVPLTTQNALLGAIMLGTTENQKLTGREERLLEVVASQIAQHLQLAWLYQMTRQMLNQRGKQLTVIEEIARQISGSRDFNDIIYNVLNAAIQTTQASMAVLALVTDTGDYWTIIHYYDEQGQFQRKFAPQAKDTGTIGRAIRTGKTLLIVDNTQDPDYLTTPPARYSSSLVVPLYRDQMPVGALNVESIYPSFFTQEQAGFLHNLGEHALISIENARLLEKLNYQVETLRSLRELSLFLSSAVDTSSVIRAVLGAAMAILHSQNAVLYRYHKLTDQLVGQWSIWIQNSEADSGVMERVARQAILTEEIQAILNVDDQPALAGEDPLMYRSMIVVPIIRGDEITEVLCVAFSEPHFFQERDVSTLSWLASQTARHLENAMLHQQIRDASSRMKAILDTTRDGVILLDRNGSLAEANPAAEKLMGFDLSNHRQSRFTDLLNSVEITNQENAAYSKEELTNLARIIRLEPGRIMQRQFEREIRPNEFIYIQEIGSPVFDEHNEIKGWLLILRDITEEKALEAYRDEITHMIVHDLRGPLASIESGVRIVEENLPELENSDLIQTTLQLSRKSAEDLMELVNTILDIAKLENKQMPLAQELTLVRELFQYAYEALLPALQKSGVEVSLVVPEDLPLVYVDARLVQRVLVNLLENARRFTPTGGHIQISAARQDRRRMLILVSDTGPGIPASERESIFEKYRQIRGSQPQRGGKGTGLGLTFCKLVVEAHSGRIWVADDGPLPGACFAFTLPIA
ncbi:MAG: GAF domain-containing protein [Anaerolineaceae bacterium]|nr:GAF domain-containing protein [Anaerolineaceae bacterium]